jgi:hypothetical protein
MSTFSINIGSATQTSGYELGGTSSDLDNIILYNFRDNVSGLVTPESVRDAVFSLNVSYPFKETTTGTTSYIGIDTLNPSGRDLKDRKLFFGKRAYSGTYSYTDPQTYNIMDSTLLSSDTDIFFYNTKLDTVSNEATKILLISGTGANTFQDSPLIQSQIVTGLTQNSTSLDFINAGDISVKSDYGTVSLNDIHFPQTANNPSNLDTLMFVGATGPTAATSWQQITFPPLSQLGGYLGVTGSPINFFGTPVYMNDYPLEFTDSRRMPIDFNDLDIGSTFSQVPLVEMLKRIVFPYLPPEGQIQIVGQYAGGYAEVGTFPSPTIQWSIKKRTFDTQITSLMNMIPGAYPAITGTGEQTILGSSIGIVISPISATSTEFKITVGDGTQSGSASTTLTGIYPYFYGYSSLATMTNVGLSSLTKDLSFKEDKELDLFGSGNYFYFIYDFNWGTLSNIYDDFGVTSSASFSATSSIFSSPTGLWAGKNFYIYKWSSPPTFTNSTLYDFNF